MQEALEMSSRLRDRVEIGARIRTVALVIIAAGVIVAGLSFLGSIFTPLFIALFLYYLTRPLYEVMVAFRIPRPIAHLILLVGLTATILVLGEVVYGNAEQFQRQMPYYRQRINAWADSIAVTFGQATPEGKFNWGALSLTQFFDVTEGDVFEFALGTTLGFLEVSLMVMFYLYFIVMETRRLPERVLKAYDPAAANQILMVAHNISGGIKQYLLVKTMVNLGIALSTAILLYLFGVQFWPLWAVLAFLANYITYIGSLVALVPPIILAFVGIPSVNAAMVLSITLVANRLFWVDFVEIRLSGRALNISPLILLLSIAFWGWLWGVIGMVLAVPLTTFLKIVLANFENTRALAILISEE